MRLRFQRGRRFRSPRAPSGLRLGRLAFISFFKKINRQADKECYYKYGEKLVLLSEASDSILAVLPPIPPSEERPYQGAKDTAAARASLQHALDNYKPGTLTHSFQPSSADLERSDSRSFGVTHEAELSSISSAASTGPEKQAAVSDGT